MVLVLGGVVFVDEIGHLWNNHIIKVQLNHVRVFKNGKWCNIYYHTSGFMSRFIPTSKHIVIDCHINDVVVIDTDLKTTQFAIDGIIRCANDELIITSTVSSFNVYSIDGINIWTVGKPYIGCCENCYIVDSETFIVGKTTDDCVYVMRRGREFQYIGREFSVISSDDLFIFRHRDYIEIKNRQLITVRRLDGEYGIISPEYIHRDGILYNLYGQELCEFDHIGGRDYNNLIATLPPLPVFDEIQPYLGMLPDPLIRIVEGYI